MGNKKKKTETELLFSVNGKQHIDFIWFRNHTDQTYLHNFDFNDKNLTQHLNEEQM